jgi:hypothetical protein
MKCQQKYIGTSNNAENHCRGAVVVCRPWYGDIGERAVFS